jgi:hypothetical protein
MRHIGSVAVLAGLFACSTNAPSGPSGDVSNGDAGVATSSGAATGQGTMAAASSSSGTSASGVTSSATPGTTSGTTGTTTSTATGTTSGTTAQDASVAGGSDGGAIAAPEAGPGASVNEAGSDDDSGYVNLFNGTDLTGFLVYEQTTTTSAGTLLTGAAAEAIFQPEAGDAGVPVIHVYGDLPNQSKQELYILETVASYAHYNLYWEYQWGTKKFQNQTDGTASATNLTLYPRDAGLMWAINGDLTQVWPSSVEFQNKWGTTGDIFALYSQVESYGMPGSATSLTTYEPPDAGGVETLVNGSNGYVQHHRSADWEVTTNLIDGGVSTDGAGTGWNECLLQANGGAGLYYVNGHLVNQTASVMDATGKPVTSGPVAWQAESAEVYYRNMRIQVLP